jgi:hypothetical protein
MQAGAEAPSGEPAAPIELAVGPGRRRAVVVPQAEGRPIGVADQGVVEQIEEGLGRGPGRELGHR